MCFCFYLADMSYSGDVPLIASLVVLLNCICKHRNPRLTLNLALAPSTAHVSRGIVSFFMVTKWLPIIHSNPELIHKHNGVLGKGDYASVPVTQLLDACDI